MQIESKTENKTKINRYIIRAIVTFLIFGAVIFLLAGRLDYWQGWSYVLLNIVIIFLTIYIFRDNPELVMERQKPGPGVKWWDKVFYAFFLPANLAYVVIGPLDSGRYHWTSGFPWYGYVAGFLLYILSHIIKNWAMYVNPYFSSMVRIQKDRGQKVIQKGPYARVRHPGYTSVFFLGTGTALIFGSWWALIPAGFTILLIFIRTWLEDITLQKELEGYREYQNKVRYRLIPGVW
jgi:protein-S-isoprenylcysteine O-methyltransferase Ste14